MTSMPASRRARATTLMPLSCPSSPGFATRMRGRPEAIGNEAPCCSEVDDCYVSTLAGGPERRTVTEAQAGAHDLAYGLADPGSFELREDGLSSPDPLGYPGYRDALTAAAERAKTDESVVSGMATIGGHRVELASFQFDFLGGSMGEVAG